MWAITGVYNYDQNSIQSHAFCEKAALRRSRMILTFSWSRLSVSAVLWLKSNSSNWREHLSHFPVVVGGHQDMGGCLANGTLRRLGLCHSVPARRIQSPPYRRDPAPRRSICGEPPPPGAVTAQATGAVRVLRHPSHRLPPPAAQSCPTAAPRLTLICLLRTWMCRHPESTDWTAAEEGQTHSFLVLVHLQ